MSDEILTWILKEFTFSTLLTRQVNSSGVNCLRLMLWCVETPSLNKAIGFRKEHYLLFGIFDQLTLSNRLLNFAVWKFDVSLLSREL